MAWSHPNRIISSEPSSPHNWAVFLQQGSRLFRRKHRIKVFFASLNTAHQREMKSRLLWLQSSVWKKSGVEEKGKLFCPLNSSQKLHFIYICFSNYFTQPNSWMKWYHAPGPGNNCIDWVGEASYEDVYKLINMKIFKNFKHCGSPSSHMHTGKKGIIHNPSCTGELTCPLSLVRS